MDIKKPQLVKVGAFDYFFREVLQHPPGKRWEVCLKICLYAMVIA